MAWNYGSIRGRGTVSKPGIEEDEVERYSSLSHNALFPLAMTVSISRLARVGSNST